MGQLIQKAIAWALARKPVRAFFLYVEHNGPALADSVTYRTLFSLFAGVLLGFSIATLYLAGNPDAWAALIGAVNAAIPGLVGTDGSGGLIQLDDIQAPAGLTLAGIVGLIGLLAAAAGAVGTLRVALRSIADQGILDAFILFTLLKNLGLAVLVGLLLVVSAAATLLATAGLGLLTDLLGLPAENGLVAFGTWAVSIVVVYALDAVVIAVLFRGLSGVRPRARTLWAGALLGAVGLIVLQQLSGLFIGGATSNPLLASFASLIALLLWLNLSAQVILIAAAYIVTGMEEDDDRVRARHGARTFFQRRVQRAENAVRVATDELTHARELEEKERVAALEG